ncbi:MAG: hypothetical protein ABH811_00365 [archaeon]
MIEAKQKTNRQKNDKSLNIGLIVLIILTVLVLLAVLIGFTFGWDSLAFWLPGDNLLEIQEQCNLACSKNGNSYDYCIVERTLKTKNELNLSCKEFLEQGYEINDCTDSCDCENVGGIWIAPEKGVSCAAILPYDKKGERVEYIFAGADKKECCIY